jgi:hypothetical protein
MKNPFEQVPAQWRLAAYCVLLVAATIWSCYQAADGDWDQFIGGVLTALINLMAASNVKKKQV